MEAQTLLARYGHVYPGTPDELMAWLRTDTPYPNPSPADLLDVPFLVVHEIVEIAEARGMGLRITKDVIVRNMERINDAHLRATDVELDIAIHEGRTDYVRSRFLDLRCWSRDPLLTPSQRKAYEAFRDRIEAWLRERTTEPGRGPTAGL